MGFVLDIILLAIGIGCVIYGWKCGFFKSVVSLLSGVCALLVSYTFTPALADFIEKKLVIDKIAGSITTTFASIAEAGMESGEAAVYDLSLLLDSAQFFDTVEQCGADEEAMRALVEATTANTYDAVESISFAVAQPVSAALSSIIAFICIFVAALIAIKIVTWLVGLLFKLPVLRELDKVMGIVFGVISAVFFVWIFALCADSLVNVLSTVAPGSFSTEIIESSFFVELFAKYNPLALLSGAVLSKI